MKCLLFLIILLVSTLSYGQISESNNNIGIKAGLNVADIRGEETDNFKSRISFNISLFLEYPILDNFSVQPEIQYSSQGAKFNLSGVDVVINLDYLNIPIMLKYYINDVFYGQIGPQLGYLVSSDLKAEGQDQGLGELNKLDVAINVGLGYQFYKNFLVEARYNYGFLNTQKDSSSENFNSVFQFSVGYIF